MRLRNTPLLDQGMIYLRHQNPRAVIDLFNNSQECISKQSNKFQFIAYLERCIAARMLGDSVAEEQYFSIAINIAEWELLHNNCKKSNSETSATDEYMNRLSDELFYLLDLTDQSYMMGENHPILRINYAHHSLLSRTWKKIKNWMASWNQWMHDNWEEIEWWADKANKILDYMHRRIEANAQHEANVKRIQNGAWAPLQ